jgi:hypothetical protein
MLTPSDSFKYSGLYGAILNVLHVAAKHANSTAFLVKVAKQLGQGMRQSSRMKDIAAVPNLWDVLVMDMVIARYNQGFDSR